MIDFTSPRRALEGRLQEKNIEVRNLEAQETQEQGVIEAQMRRIDNIQKQLRRAREDREAFSKAIEMFEELVEKQQRETMHERHDRDLALAMGKIVCPPCMDADHAKCFSETGERGWEIRPDASSPPCSCAMTARPGPRTIHLPDVGGR